MTHKSGNASQNVTPRDAQKGGQGALSEAHPEIALGQDAFPTEDVPPPGHEVRNGLTDEQISLLCGIDEHNLGALTGDKKRDLERLLSEGYVARSEKRAVTDFELTAKGIDFLSKRGAGLNYA